MNPLNLSVETSSPSKKFWLMSQNVAVVAKYAPFVVCLASGKLDEDAFRLLIALDAHFLRAFEIAYMKAEEYADDGDAKVAVSNLRRAVSDKLYRLNNSIAQDLGIFPTQEVLTNPAIMKYTCFLSDISDGKINGEKVTDQIVTTSEMTRIAAYTVGAVAPCMRLYAFLSREFEPFLSLYGSDRPYYKNWMNIYSPLNFEKAAVQIEDLLDKLTVLLTEEDLEVLQKVYLQAMKLAIEFLFLQPICIPSVAPLSRLHDPKNQLFIFSDFDSTCTLLDTSILAPKSAYHPVSDNHTNQMSSLEIKDPRVAISLEYTKDYEKCIETLLPSEAKTFDLEYIYKSLEQLLELEKWANSRDKESGILMGMYINDIQCVGEHLVQDGCARFFQKIVGQREQLNGDLHILSHRWSSDFMRAAFSSAGCLADFMIHGNEFEYQRSVTRGVIVKRMESSLEKVQVFKGILTQNCEDTEFFSVYIGGGTVGDLLCLLEANVGIVIGSSEVLRKVGKRFGISFLPLSHGLVEEQREAELHGSSSAWKARTGVLYTVSGWSEIHAFILGMEPTPDFKIQHEAADF
ncbi:hypothetical protein KSP39_PZI000577 [Platanthera zijinensis]|uniref:Thiaminase-2/PQQC domain-containing protein n=1 Tax=Platanthera zijinensis TaxID=2320716 RepID=A0AAP0GFY4_9ASPA